MQGAVDEVDVDEEHDGDIGNNANVLSPALLDNNVYKDDSKWSLESKGLCLNFVCHFLMGKLQFSHNSLPHL